MFSFFKRAKKDQDGNGSTKDKKSKEKNSSKNDTPSPTSAPKDMCKNKSAEKSESALQSGNINVTPNIIPSAESRLRENGNETVRETSDEVTAKNEKEVTVADAKIETNLPNTSNIVNFSDSAEKIMEMSQNGPAIKHSPSPVTSYANVVKSELQQRRSSVKPCGHGTVAIAPKIPLPNKREIKSATPPGSPDVNLGAKPKYRRVHSYEEKDDLDKLKNGKVPHVDDPVSDTVTAAIKLKVDLPLVSKPPLSKTSPNKALNNESKHALVNGLEDEAAKKNLINQEAKFQSQLNELSKQLSIRDAEANKLRFQMEELQRDVFAKSAGMDRLQAELQAALKESENVRQKIQHLENDLLCSQRKSTDLSEELTVKTERFNNFQSTTNAKITELQSTIRGLRAKIESLEIQIDILEKEKDGLEKQKVALIQQRDEDKKALDEALEKAIQDKASLQKKWEEDFEKLRTVNIVKEQELLDDFEWKLREIEQSCKRRLQEKDRKIEDQLQEAYKDAEKKIKQAEKIMHEVENLKSYECEVRQLRGLTIEQQKSLDVITSQVEEMKATEQSLKNETKRLRTLVDMEKENLQHMQRMHNHEILDKERKLKEAMQEQKTAIAFYWEDRLLHECRRLKSELDQLHYEERHVAIQSVKSETEQELNEIKQQYEKKIQEYLKEVSNLKRSLKEKDQYYEKQLEITQTKTDRDIFELRRIMDKIDMSHHDKFEKLVREHEEELERISKEHEKQLKDLEGNWQLQLSSMRATVELVKEQMEKESQQKMQMLIDQHRSELDTQWENLIHQKNEAIRLVEDEYVTKYKTLEEQFYTQQKSHESREIELLKAIDTLKNEIISKDSTIEDLQNNVDTLEGGIQVLNQEMAYHGEAVNKTKIDADYKIRELQEAIKKLQEQQQKERDELQMKFSQIQKQSQATIDHLQRKCQCLTKLFEEVRGRYERRESRQEDLNIISDLRQVIAEQEKDLACLNEEKRYFQMRMMNLERFLEESGVPSEAVASQIRTHSNSPFDDDDSNASSSTNIPLSNQISIPPTIPECDDDFEDALA